jgi:predicted ATPase with chaperone activity
VTWRNCADLEGAGSVRRVHVAEALIYRRVGPGTDGVGKRRTGTFAI